MKQLSVSLTLLASSLLAACGGGGGGGGAGPTSTVLSGTASKGIMRNAIVTAYSVTNGAKGTALQSARTSAAGTYTLSLADYAGPVLLEMTADGSTRMICDVPAGCSGSAFGAEVALPTDFKLLSALPSAGGNISAAITPFTDLAVRRALSQGLTGTTISQNLNQVADLFDLPPLTSTQPTDVTGTVAAGSASTPDQQRYALLNAAIGSLAGGNPAQFGPVIGDLAQDFINRNGQLVIRSSDPANQMDLESVLQAASDVASAPAAAANLSNLVTVVVAESLTQAQAATADTNSAAAGTSTNPVGLAAAKAFVDQAHDFVQSLLATDTPTVRAEVDAKFARITLLSENSDAVSLLGDALCLSTNVMVDLAQDVAVNNSTNTDLDSTELSALPDAVLGCSVPESRLEVTFNPGFTVKATPATSTVTANGVMTLQRYFDNWQCGNDGCYPDPVPVGAPINVNVSNFSLAYPAFGTSATSFTMGVTSGGFVETSAAKLEVSSATGSGITLGYAASATLSSHLDALEDGIDGNDAAHTPQSMQIVLNGARLTAKQATSHEFGQFTGTVNVTLRNADLPLVNGLPGARRVTAADTASLAGTLTSASGESLQASISIDLDNDLGSQAIASPEAGYHRDGLYQVTEEEGAAVVRLSTGTLQGFDFWLEGIDGVRLSIQEATEFSCRRLLITPLRGNEAADSAWPVSGTCLGDEVSLTVALQQELAQGFESSVAWYLSANIPGEGHYQPASFALGGFAGELLWAHDDVLQTDTAFVRGAFSATLKLTLGGSANVDGEVSISGHRVSLTGGDVIIQVKNNGQWLRLAGSGTNLATATNITLSNQAGGSIVLSPVALNDDNPDNDGADLTINGETYGRLYRVAGAWVVRFSDDSFTLL